MNGRVLNPHNIKEIVSRLAQERQEFLSRFEKVMIDTQNFAMAASTAIGDISYYEAVDGVITYFRDEMKKVS